MNFKLGEGLALEHMSIDMDINAIGGLGGCQAETCTGCCRHNEDFA